MSYVLSTGQGLLCSCTSRCCRERAYFSTSYTLPTVYVAASISWYHRLHAFLWTVDDCASGICNDVCLCVEATFMLVFSSLHVGPGLFFLLVLLGPLECWWSLVSSFVGSMVAELNRMRWA